MGEVDLLREELFDELLAELALHEGVRGDLADVTGAARSPPALHGELEESFGERDGEGVLAGAARVALAGSSRSPAASLTVM